MTIPFSDFPDMVGGVEVDSTLTWDFKLPTGVTLTGSPTVTATVYRLSEQPDSAPQSRVISTVVGTAENGVTNCAVLAKFGPAPVGVKYLLVVSCARSDGGVAACFNHILAAEPK